MENKFLSNPLDGKLTLNKENVTELTLNEMSEIHAGTTGVASVVLTVITLLSVAAIVTGLPPAE
jgi:hypothetical protein